MTTTTNRSRLLIALALTSVSILNAQPVRTQSVRTEPAIAPPVRFQPGTALPAVALTAGAQRGDDTQLKQVIIFGRHSVRAPVADNAILDIFSVKRYPVFSVGTGLLTPNGAKLETLLGSYYRLWLTSEKLLTGNDLKDASAVYFRSNVIERTIVTAQSFASGLLPAASINVNHYGPTESDPLFNAVGARVARLDRDLAVAAVNGQLGGNAGTLASAYAPELALTRSLLFGYPAGETPAPVTPQGLVDVTTVPIAITEGTGSTPVNIGGLTTLGTAVDPFLMEYADGMPASDVGWGQLTAAGISQISRLYMLGLDLQFRTPYLAGVQSSNLASHVVRTMVQSATGNAMTGSLGGPSTKVVMLVASDVNIIGLAGLLHLDWILPGYPSDFCSPGGALVFELRQSQSTGEYLVRASYRGQTLDQLRNLTVLTLAAPPAIAPVFIPGCSTRNSTFDCPLDDFVRISRHAIDPLSVDLTDVNQ